jgi:hypothetical protein
LIGLVKDLDFKAFGSLGVAGTALGNPIKSSQGHQKGSQVSLELLVAD